MWRRCGSPFFSLFPQLIPHIFHSTFQFVSVIPTIFVSIELKHSGQVRIPKSLWFFGQSHFYFLVGANLTVNTSHGFRRFDCYSVLFISAIADKVRLLFSYVIRHPCCCLKLMILKLVQQFSIYFFFTQKKIDLVKNQIDFIQILILHFHLDFYIHKIKN